MRRNLTFLRQWLCETGSSFPVERLQSEIS